MALQAGKRALARVIVVLLYNVRAVAVVLVALVQDCVVADPASCLLHAVIWHSSLSASWYSLQYPHALCLHSLHMLLLAELLSGYSICP